MSPRAFWPPGEAAQADYEALREGVLSGIVPASAAVRRFSEGGLVALIARPSRTEPAFVALVVGAPRPAWTPHVDPRVETLACGYGLLLAGAEGQHDEGEAGRRLAW